VKQELEEELDLLNLYKKENNSISNDELERIEKTLIPLRKEAKAELDAKNRFEDIFHIDLPAVMTTKLYTLIRVMLSFYDMMNKAPK
jgi:hypothetical protein